MFGSGLFNWFSSKQEPTNGATWDSTTASVQNQQPTSPEAPSTERVVTEQPVRTFAISTIFPSASLALHLLTSSFAPRTLRTT